MTKELELDNSMFENGKLTVFIIRSIHFVAASSYWSKMGLVEFGFNENQVKVMTLGVDPKIFFPISLERRDKIRNKFGIKKEDFILLSIGAMTENKGIKELLLAFCILRKKNKNIKLILKDQSNLYNIFAKSHITHLKNSKFKDLINDDITSNIIFMSNNLNYEQINDLYGISDCYVSPYLAEGFGLTPLEASSAGTPIVVTKGGSTDDYFNSIMGAQISSKLIKDKNATYLRPNVDSLVENINLIISNPKNYGGKNSHNLIAHELSVKKSVQKLLNEIKL
jgi:glycosyltransferase involved in cell wall biosynthesis